MRCWLGALDERGPTVFDGQLSFGQRVQDGEAALVQPSVSQTSSLPCVAVPEGESRQLFETRRNGIGPLANAGQHHFFVRATVDFCCVMSSH